MSHGVLNLVCKMFYLSIVILLVIDVTYSQEKKKKKKRCKKVCAEEFDALKQRVRDLEAKLDRLLQQKNTALQGAKGEKGDPGRTGPKGDRGLIGMPGRNGKDGYAISKLPKCLAGEYITSDGTNLMCTKLGNIVGPNIKPGNKVTPTSITNVLTTISTKSKRQDMQPPTIPAEMEKQMTKFKKKYMIQTLYADTWDVHSFIWQQNTYLGISQLSTKTFTLYKWVHDVFVEKAVLTIQFARKWTSFEWEGNLYIVIACNTRRKNGAPAYSYIYKMASYDTIELFQRLETNTAFGVDTIKKNGQLFIAFVYLYSKSSDIFKWDSGRFVKDHSIPVSGSDIDAFHIGHRAFLSVVGMTTQDPYAYLLEYRNGQFVPFKNIPMETRPYGVKHIKVGKDHFLAVARYHLPRSVLLKWNGETFEESQLIDSCKARGFATITTRQMGKSVTYMAVINFDCKPVIYVYDETSKSFVKLQETDSKWTRDIEFLRMPSSDTVYLAVATNRQTTIYAGKS